MDTLVIIKDYITDIDKLYQTGITTEHSFRPALQRLMEQCTGFRVVNEQRHIDCGAPDMTLLKSNMAVCYIECKDLEDGDLDGRKANKEQFDRYKASLDTLIFTDYLDFHLYEHGEWCQSVRLAEIQGKHIRPSDIARFADLLEHIRTAEPQSIISATKLASIMAGKARLLRDVIERALEDDIQAEERTKLRGYMEAFKQVLINDITPKSFADIYAQTIAYGMFAARLYDETPDDFSRHEAAELIPKTNPFLRKIFQDIAGYDLDERIAWIVDDLVAAFRVTKMDKIMSNFGKSTQMTDPLMNFYEDFLSQYDKTTKKSCGVYYTPQPVVQFIVRAVDDILKNDFGLPMGLADSSRVEKNKRMTHRVQVLDPATGTGTFLAEVVRHIKSAMANQMGAWDSYVTDHLIPRLHGFELMMAPYTITHLKLDLELGTKTNKRFNVYLTNSLEEYHKDANTLWSYDLAEEANAASEIKKEAPIMVMIGNPPYSVSSNNKGEWIGKLLEDYKKDLNERNIQPLSDDYIKFIRLGQHYVERNNEGILAYISNNSFIDGLIHRQMRRELMRCFDKIYILDLHGNTRKKETAPDGGKDDNVFDIMQGVSINIFVKTGNHSNKEAEVYHYDLFGDRDSKYTFLQNHNLNEVEWTRLNPKQPQFFFVPKDFGAEDEYGKGFSINEILKINSCGVKTHHDAELISTKPFSTNDNKPYDYRPFDHCYIDYNLSKVVRSRFGFMKHMLKNNMALSVSRQCIDDWKYVLVTEQISDINLIASAGKLGGGYVFPLYLYPEEGSIDTERRPNLDEAIWAAINEKVGSETTPEDIFDYIYGVLHSPSYRERYKEFLKVDFPRVPYPTNKEVFEHFVYYGHKLRELHLMHTPARQDVATFPEAGTCIVDAIRWDKERVYINDTQYFDHVPATAWNAYIGGYQPAQKWLKDRKTRTLTIDDVAHYQHIIAILLETDRLMHEIDTHPFQHKPSSKQDGEQKGKVEIHYHIDHMDINTQTASFKSDDMSIDNVNVENYHE